MAYSVNWITRVVSIPASDLTLISGTRYKMDMFTFLIEMRRLESSFTEGLWAAQTVEHTNPKLNFAGADYAGFDEIINNYTLTFTGVVTRVDLVGSNNNVFDVFNANGVSVAANNSAGLQKVSSSSGLLPGDVEDITDSVLGSPIAPYEDTETLAGAVTHLKHLRYMLFINTELGVDGDGSQHSPFNNETSAIDYAEAHGIKMLMIMADITFTRQIKNFEIHGVGVPQVDLNGQDINGTLVLKCRPTGLYVGSAVFQDCNLNGLMTLNGYIENCAVSGRFQIPNGGTAFVKGTAALVAGQIKPVFDIGGVAGTANLVLMDYDGGCTIENCNQPTDDVKLVVNHGIIELDASCTDGNIFMFGDVELIRGDSGSAVFDWTKPPSEQKDILASVMYRRVTDELAKTITLYEKDGLTQRKVFGYTENGDGAIIEIDPQ